MIRIAQLSDVNRMAEIHVFGWRCAYRGIVADEILFNRFSVEKRIKSFTKAMHEGIDEVYVFEDNNLIKGILTIGKCRDEDKSTSFELMGIYIEPLMKRKGIGKQLVQFCEEMAKQRKFTEIVLWVLRENAESILFYRKMGFLPDGKEELMENIGVFKSRYIKSIKN